MSRRSRLGLTFLAVVALSCAVDAFGEPQDPRLAGVWTGGGSSRRGGRYSVVWVIDTAGNYTWFLSGDGTPTFDQGTIYASTRGQIQLRSTVDRSRRGGMFQLADENRLTLTVGRDATEFTRWMSMSGMDRAFVGAWSSQSSGRTLRVEADGRYRVDGASGGESEGGRGWASGGRYAFLGQANSGAVIRLGRYAAQGGDRLVLTPEGGQADAWARVGPPGGGDGDPVTGRGGESDPSAEPGPVGTESEEALIRAARNLVELSRAGDAAALEAAARGWRLPDARAWFARTFGASGESLAAEYEERARGIGAALAERLSLQPVEVPTVDVAVFRSADDPKASPAQRRLLESMAEPITLYEVALLSPSGGRLVVMEACVFVGGGFRWLMQ